MSTSRHALQGAEVRNKTMQQGGPNKEFSTAAKRAGPAFLPQVYPNFVGISFDELMQNANY